MSLLARLRESARCVVLDGGLGLEAEQCGVEIKGDPLWSARLLHSDPGLLKSVHRSFLDAGADVITTASYQASPEGLSHHLSVSHEDALHLIGQSVAIAKQARTEYMREKAVGPEAPPLPLIAGSIGPYGACLNDMSEYTGDYVDTMTTEQLEAWHRPRMSELLRAGADLLAIETIPAVKEAVALVHLLGEFPNARAWLSFTCRDGQHTCHGEPFAEATCTVASCPQVLAVGVNCCRPAFVGPLLNSMHGVTGKPFVVYPNLGEDWKERVGPDGERENFVGEIPKWVELGARLVGGCCHVGPKDIAEISHCVDAMDLRTLQ